MSSPNPNNGPLGPVFTAPIPATALTTNAYDLFSLVSTVGRVELMAIELEQKSSAPANVQSLGISLFRGSTAASTGAALTASNVFGSTKAQSAIATLTGPSTVQISTTSATLVHSAAMDAADGSWRYRPERDARQLLETSQRLHLAVTAPSVAVTIAGTVTFRQVAKTTT